jgi:hypothetical protein
MRSNTPRPRPVSPQTNGICERVHQTILNEFYRVAFRKKLYQDLETLQTDLDEYINQYNFERTHQGKHIQGRTSMETFQDGKKYFLEKNLIDLTAAQKPACARGYLTPLSN